jgi:hypothetical protein
MASNQIIVHVDGIPEALFRMRLEMAKALREAALDADARSAKLLCEIADRFEVGATED